MRINFSLQSEGRGNRKWLKSELKKTRLSIAHFVVSRDSARSPVCLPSFVRESITRSPALSARRSLRLLESASISNYTIQKDASDGIFFVFFNMFQRNKCFAFEKNNKNETEICYEEDIIRFIAVLPFRRGVI